MSTGGSGDNMRKRDTMNQNQGQMTLVEGTVSSVERDEDRMLDDDIHDDRPFVLGNILEMEDVFTSPNQIQRPGRDFLRMADNFELPFRASPNRPLLPPPRPASARAVPARPAPGVAPARALPLLPPPLAVRPLSLPIRPPPGLGPAPAMPIRPPPGLAPALVLPIRSAPIPIPAPAPTQASVPESRQYHFEHASPPPAYSSPPTPTLQFIFETTSFPPAAPPNATQAPAPTNTSLPDGHLRYTFAPPEIPVDATTFVSAPPLAPGIPYRWAPVQTGPPVPTAFDWTDRAFLTSYELGTIYQYIRSKSTKTFGQRDGSNNGEVRDFVMLGSKEEWLAHQQLFPDSWIPSRIAIQLWREQKGL